MKRDTIVLLGAAAFGLGAGGAGLRNVLKAKGMNAKAEAAGNYANLHPLATGVMLFAGYKMFGNKIMKQVG